MRRLFGGRATMEAALSKTLWPSRYLWRAFFCVRTRCAQTAAKRLDDRIVCRVAWSGDVACDVALTGPPTDAAENERVAPIDADRVRTTRRWLLRTGHSIRIVAVAVVGNVGTAPNSEFGRRIARSARRPDAKPNGRDLIRLESDLDGRVESGRDKMINRTFV